MAGGFHAGLATSTELKMSLAHNKYLLRKMKKGSNRAEAKCVGVVESAGPTTARSDRRSGQAPGWTKAGLESRLQRFLVTWPGAVSPGDMWPCRLHIGRVRVAIVPTSQGPCEDRMTQI